MVFRVPSQFDSFIPPTRGPTPQASGDRPTRPWNGSLVVTGLRPSDRTISEKIHVSAVETDGENRVESWPAEMVLDILYNTDRDLRREISQWVNSTGQPTCNFIPQRIRAQNMHNYNLSSFRNLSKVLMENRTVAIAPWRTGQVAYEGAGIVIYPAPNSSAYLIGAVFHSSGFPDFIRSALSPIVSIPPASVPSYPQGQLPPMGPSSSPYSAQSHASHYRQPHSGSPQHSNSNSPVDHPGSSYRYIVPMPAHGPGQYPTQPSGSTSSPGGGGYATGYPTNNPAPFP
ncbi:hypothetical protein EST38_g5300 [Candolleomyces aberdarensis]|uniref:Uncharacterized protein n=1 Tax=Candolleomyces aberdarensis TaxID=2316362 RepID=A0A4Q2DNM1_9AGAR|nr:hypothetical protein EST38_g5300 [Candolleomyces aberdarensis]